jgi:hypothetical protein
MTTLGDRLVNDKFAQPFDAVSPRRQQAIAFGFGWCVAALLSAIIIGWLLTTKPLAMVLLYGPVIAVPQWLILRSMRLAGWSWIVATTFGPPVGAYGGFAMLGVIPTSMPTYGPSDRWSDLLLLAPLAIGTGGGAGFAQLLVLCSSPRGCKLWPWGVWWFLASTIGGCAAIGALLSLTPRWIEEPGTGTYEMQLAVLSDRHLATLALAGGVYGLLTGVVLLGILRERSVAASVIRAI